VKRLLLIQEAKVFELLGGQVDDRLEASGVLAKDGVFYVIFDNLADIACIGSQLSAAGSVNCLIRQKHGHRQGFEDIAYDRWSDRFYVLLESVPRGDRRFMAKVQEYDASFHYQSNAWLDFPLDRPNKGLEGLSCIRRDGQTYLLALCEGNMCRGGAAGRVPGGGRIQVFRRGRRHWNRVGRIRLPATLSFEDYSGISVDGDRMAIISQVSSALWVGRLSPLGWDVADEGVAYAFPRDAEDRIVYCSVEGVSWITPSRIAVVSDKAKPKQGKRCKAKDQSIHIFEIPGGS
jgi:hypothetical protein